MRTWMWAAVAAALPMGCEELGVGTEEGEVVLRFESERVDLVPAGFPVYPKAFSTESLGMLVDETLSLVTYQAAVDDFAGGICALVLTVNVCLSDLLANADYSLIDGAINTQVPEIRGWATDQLSTQLRFYNPGPLGVGVSERIGSTVRNVVSIDGIQLHMKVRNRTDEVWGVPIRFSLFAGDSAAVVGKTAMVRAAQADPEQPFTFMVPAGETQELVVEAPDLVTALNDLRSLTLDYDAVVEVADLDPATFQGWLSADRGDMDGNGVADDLASWGLVFEELSITVSGTGDLNVPVTFPDWMVDLIPAGAPAP
ncbi:MAG: hypothetical protein KTR31_24145 [Myxococcales bacterium]|nr:hypothetical protein [Myxococcales bacterium]